MTFQPRSVTNTDLGSVAYCYVTATMHVPPAISAFCISDYWCIINNDLNLQHHPSHLTLPQHTPLHATLGSSVHLDFTRFLLVFLHPTFYYLPAAYDPPPSSYLCRPPPVITPTMFSTVSPWSLADSTMTFDSNTLPSSPFTSHIPPGVGVGPPTVPPLPAGGQRVEM